jgi:hypothetical protein
VNPGRASAVQRDGEEATITKAGCAAQDTI